MCGRNKKKAEQPKADDLLTIRFGKFRDAVAAVDSFWREIMGTLKATAPIANILSTVSNPVASYVRLLK